MEEEDDAPTDTKEFVIWHATRSFRQARHFCMTQPIIAFLLFFALYYLVSINRKLNRLESAFTELVELQTMTQEQLIAVTTTTNQETLEQEQNL